MSHQLKIAFLALLAFMTAPLAISQVDPDLPALPVLDPDRVHSNWLDFEPEFTPYVCPFHAQAPDYDPEEFRCGYVLVPEDRTKPDSRLIKLSVLKIQSTSENPERRAVMRLTGGPGGPSLGAGRIYAYQGANTKEFREVADLIFFDQRGIGYSEGHFCRAVPRNFQFGVPIEEGVERSKVAFEKCLEEARARGIEVDGYTTWQNALDVRDIRIALGYDQWTLFGVSYGTSLGQAILHVDEEGVRAAILDSVVPATPLETGGWEATAYGFSSALNALDADCAADPACARDVGSFRERFIKTFEAYDADPIIMDSMDPGSALNGTVVLDGDLAGGAVFQALYSETLYADFPSLLTALESRDVEAIEAYFEVLGRPIDHAAGNGLELVANCRGAIKVSEEQFAEMRRAEPQLSNWTDTVGWVEVCDAVYDLGPDPTVKRVVTDVPILVAAGTADPITPPNYSQSIMSDLANGQYVEFPHTGHGALFSHSPGCGQDLWVAFVKDPMAELDTSCLADVTAPKFLTRLIETKAPYKFARGLQSGAYPYGAILAAVLLAISVIMFPLGWTARKLQGLNAPAMRHSRAITWGGALFTLGGLAWAITQILATATQHPMALPLGVLPSTGLAFWLGLIGFALTAFALYRGATSEGFGRRQLGASIGLVVTCLAALGALIFLFSLGIGPF
ncbi:MAG: alpha/beta fold hydrolase [Henriciella sp.]|nr:alpha/beta fold hydrolase [Henriciella sp.]